jgi:hypothetical protein
MPDYDALAAQGIYNLKGDGASDIRVFAGTVADPFFIDLGATFDSLNYRAGSRCGSTDSRTGRQRSAQFGSGFRCRIQRQHHRHRGSDLLLTSDGADPRRHGSERNHRRMGDNLQAEVTIRRSPWPAENFGRLAQVQRLGNPLINELIIGTGSKDFWSMSEPVNDSQFAAFDLDPLIARVFNAVYGFNIPTPPRTDLLPLVTYAAPIAPKGTPAGPIADLLRLNTGVPPTPMRAQASGPDRRRSLPVSPMAAVSPTMSSILPSGWRRRHSEPRLRCRAEQPARRWRQRSRRSSAGDVPVCSLCIQWTRQPPHQPGRSNRLRQPAERPPVRRTRMPAR